MFSNTKQVGITRTTSSFVDFYLPTFKLGTCERTVTTTVKVEKSCSGSYSCTKPVYTVIPAYTECKSQPSVFCGGPGGATPCSYYQTNYPGGDLLALPNGGGYQYFPPDQCTYYSEEIKTTRVPDTCYYSYDCSYTENKNTIEYYDCIVLEFKWVTIEVFSTNTYYETVSEVDFDIF